MVVLRTLICASRPCQVDVVSESGGHERCGTFLHLLSQISIESTPHSCPRSQSGRAARSADQIPGPWLQVANDQPKAASRAQRNTGSYPTAERTISGIATAGGTTIMATRHFRPSVLTHHCTLNRLPPKPPTAALPSATLTPTSTSTHRRVARGRPDTASIRSSLLLPLEVGAAI
jgi:hypothetical protein